MAATSTPWTARSRGNRARATRPRCGRVTGSKLTYHVDAPVTLACTIDGKDTPVDYAASATFTLEVTDAEQVGETWMATELAYTRDCDADAGAAAAAKGCPTGKQTESGTGVPAPSSPATTVTTGRRPDDDWGYSDDRSLSRFPISSRRFCRSR